MTTINKLSLTLLVFLSGCYPREDPNPEPPESYRRDTGQTIVIDSMTEIITDTIYIEI